MERPKQIIIDDPIKDSGTCTACQKRPANSKQIPKLCQYCAKKAKNILQNALQKPEPPKPTEKPKANIIDGRRLVPGVRLKVGDNILRVRHAGEDFICVELIGKGKFKKEIRGTLVYFGNEKKNYMVDNVCGKEALLRVMTLLDK